MIEEIFFILDDRKNTKKEIKRLFLVILLLFQCSRMCVVFQYKLQLLSQKRLRS